MYPRDWSLSIVYLAARFLEIFKLNPGGSVSFPSTIGPDTADSFKNTVNTPTPDSCGRKSLTSPDQNDEQSSTATTYHTIYVSLTACDTCQGWHISWSQYAWPIKVVGHDGHGTVHPSHSVIPHLCSQFNSRVWPSSSVGLEVNVRLGMTSKSGEITPLATFTSQQLFWANTSAGLELGLQATGN